MAFHRPLAYHDAMLPPERTQRQRIIELLSGTRLSSHQLAQMLGIAERQVEDHLTHVVKTLLRDRSQRFILEPSTCPDCGYVFRDRIKLTRPSRCPECRSEGITAPRYGIESVRSRSRRVDSSASSR
ncbi:MAG: transcriptional regulator [Nitrospiraceae bacterium]